MEGRRHDAFILTESGILHKLQPHTHRSGQPFVVYGDPAYGVRQNILSPFRGQLTQSEKEFNSTMSSMRQLNGVLEKLFSSSPSLILKRIRNYYCNQLASITV